MVNGPVRATNATESLIDLLFTTDSDLIVHFGHSELGLSDHNLIYGILSQGVIKQKQCLCEVRYFNLMHWCSSCARPLGL